MEKLYKAENWFNEMRQQVGGKIGDVLMGAMRCVDKPLTAALIAAAFTESLIREPRKTVNDVVRKMIFGEEPEDKDGRKGSGFRKVEIEDGEGTEGT